MSVPLGPSVLSILERKGWHLYRALPGSDFVDIVRQGKATRIEPNAPYVMLPVASRDTDVGAVKVHFDNAHYTNQLPTYRDAEHTASQVEFIGLTEQGLDIKVNKEAGIYRIDLHGAEDAVKFNFSNYNRHFFSNIDELAEFFLRQGVIEQTPSVSEQLRWEIVRRSDRALIYPSNPSPVLFRGENKHYPQCYPTAFRFGDTPVPARTFRELPELEQAVVALNLIRTQWFNENLRQTPAMRWMSKEKIAFDDAAVAQHYGLRTNYIDLSQSFVVAAFFACCKYDSKKHKWRPVGDGEGTIYVVDIRHPACGDIKPVGRQPFPRPSEQWAWVYEVGMRDFGMLPDVRKFAFRHDEAASKKILDRFLGGATLFPPDALSELANTVKSRTTIPRAVAEEIRWDEIIPKFVADNEDAVGRDACGFLGGEVQAVLAKIEELMDVVFSESADLHVATEVMKEDMDAVRARWGWGKTWGSYAPDA